MSTGATNNAYDDDAIKPKQKHGILKNNKSSNHSQKSIEFMTASHGSNLRMPGMHRTITAQAKANSASLWRVMDTFKDGKIQWDEWGFVLKKLTTEKNNGDPILSNSEMKFLFSFLDKTGKNEVTKTEFEGLFNDVCAKNEKITDHIVLIQIGHKMAVEQQQRMGGIDWKIHQNLNEVDEKVTLIIANMATAKIYYKMLNDNCENPPPKGDPCDPKKQPNRQFYAGHRVFESPLHTYKADIEKYRETVKIAAGGGLLNKYNNVMERLEAAERVVFEVNELLQQFLEQGAIIKELKAKDEKCCKIFGMLCC